MKISHATAALLALLALSACEAENHGSIQVFGICVIDGAEDCGTSGKCEKVLAARPFVFTSAERLGGGVSANALELWVQVDNQLLPNGDPELFRVNTNDFTIEEYFLEFRAPGLSIPSVTVPAGSLTIRADTSQTPLIPVIPAQTLATIGGLLPNPGVGQPPARVVVGVDLTIRGRLQDGTEHDAAPFRIDVDVIDGIGGLPVCPAGETVTAICPNEGQTASFDCESATTT